MERLRRSATFQASLASLRSAGWKDWHILLAVMNVTLNFRLKRLVPQGANPDVVKDTQRRLLNTPEDESSIVVPDEEFTEDNLRM